MADQVRRIVAVFSAQNQAKGQLASFQRDMDRTGQTMRRMAKRALALAGVGGGLYALKSGLTASIREFASFEKQMAKVSTMLDAQAMQLMPLYTRQIRDMAKKFGESTETLSKGLYDILSASIAPEKALKVLETSLRSAKGGFTETAVVTAATVRILEAYNMEASEAARVNDILHATVRKGIMDFEGLSSNIGDVIGLAAYLDIELEALGASLATMSKSLSIDKSVTALKNILNQFKYPTEAARGAARELGFALDETSVKGKGLITIIQRLSKAEARHLNVLMPSLRGLVGFAGQLKNVAAVTENYDFILNSAGLQQEAFEKAVAITSFKLDQQGEEWKLLKGSIGRVTSSLVVDFFKGLTMIIEDTTEAVGGLKKSFETIQIPKSLFPLFPPIPKVVGPSEVAEMVEIRRRFILPPPPPKPDFITTFPEVKKFEEPDWLKATLALNVMTEAQEKAQQSMYEMSMKARGLSDELAREKKLTQFAALAKVRYGKDVAGAQGAIERFTKALKESEEVKIQEAAKKQQEAAIESAQQMLSALDFEYDMLGKISEERERAISLAQFKVTLEEAFGEEQHRTVEEQVRMNELMDEYNEKLDKIAKGARGPEVFQVKMKRWATDATNVWSNLGDVATRALDNTADALTDMCLQGKADFRSLAQSIIADLTRMIIKMQMARAIGLVFPGLTGPMFGGGGGGGGGGYTPGSYSAGAGTMYQHGGIAARPHLAMVGEVPEAIVPLSGGRSIPVEMRGGGGGGGPQITEHRIINQGSEKLEISRIEEYILSDRRIIEVTMQAMQTNIKYRRSITQARS